MPETIPLTPRLDSIVLERGEQVRSVDPMVAFSQLIEPNPENPLLPEVTLDTGGI
jgi:hypothetical protein